jgi:hypothetical protein
MTFVDYRVGLIVMTERHESRESKRFLGERSWPFLPRTFLPGEQSSWEKCPGRIGLLGEMSWENWAPRRIGFLGE